MLSHLLRGSLSVHQVENLEPSQHAGAIMAVESARVILVDYDDEPQLVHETADGYIVLGASKAVVMSDVGGVDLLDVAEATTPPPGKLIPVDSPVYNARIKLPKYNGPQSVLSAHGSDSGKLLTTRLPGWTKDDHEKAADAHEKEAARLEKEWGDLADKAAMATWGRKWQVTDYRISGVGSDEFADEWKDKLRAAAHGKSAHGGAAYAHRAAAKLRRVPRESIEEAGGVLKPRSTDRGFYGNIANRPNHEAAKKAWNDAWAKIQAAYKTTPEETRAVLDSRTGSHLADAYTDGRFDSDLKSMAKTIKQTIAAFRKDPSLFETHQSLRDDGRSMQSRNDEAPQLMKTNFATIRVGDGVVELVDEASEHVHVQVECDTEDQAEVSAAVEEVTTAALEEGFSQLAEDDEQVLEGEAFDAFEAALIDDLQSDLAELVGAHEGVDAAQHDIALFDEACREFDYEAAVARAEAIATTLGEDALVEFKRRRGRALSTFRRSLKIQTPAEKMRNRKARRAYKSNPALRRKAKMYRKKFKRFLRNSTGVPSNLDEIRVVELNHELPAHMRENYASSAHADAFEGKAGSDDALLHAAMGFFGGTQGQTHSFAGLSASMQAAGYTGVEGASDSQMMAVLGRLVKEDVLRYVRGKGFTANPEAFTEEALARLVSEEDDAGPSGTGTVVIRRAQDTDGTSGREVVVIWPGQAEADLKGSTGSTRNFVSDDEENAEEKIAALVTIAKQVAAGEAPN